MRRLSLLFLGLLPIAVACSSADVTPGNSSADGGESADGAVSVTDGGAGGDTGNTPDPTVTFKFQFDYRFDKKGFFSDPKRRAALEGAGRIWGRLIKSSFSNIPKGTFVLVRNPEQPTVAAQSFNIEYEIDDVVVFVGSAELGGGTLGTSSPTFGLSGITDSRLATALSERQTAVPFQPWTAWCAFDENTPWFFDDSADSSQVVPGDQMDFLSVALHELGHILGFGTADPFKGMVSGGKFTGAKAVALFGGPVPLSGPAHFPNDILGADRPLMDVSDSAGTRYAPKPLDIAVFQDLGYLF